jgi:hypothetical protein
MWGYPVSGSFQNRNSIETPCAMHFHLNITPAESLFQAWCLAIAWRMIANRRRLCAPGPHKVGAYVRGSDLFSI